MGMFLAPEDLADLTGCKVKSKQIDALKKMGIPFWVNAVGRPVVSVSAIEGRKEAPPAKVWVMPRVNHGKTPNR